MSTTRRGWIGWWIVTVALLALVVVAISCNRGDGTTGPDPGEGPDAPKVGEPPPPPPPGPLVPRPNQPGQQRPEPQRPDGGGALPPHVGHSTAPRDVLQQLRRAQQAFVAAVNVDEDFDSRGEYGGLSELSRASGGRMGRPIAKALIPPELGQLNQRGEGRRGDYLYRMWLPGRHGLGVGELWGGAGAAQFEPNLAEDYWVCYAWPASGSGPTYFISQDGRLLMTDDARYSGSGRGPRSGAALGRGTIEDMLAPPAVNARGLDGNTWRTAQ